MKWMDSSTTTERAFGVYILLAVLLFGHAMLKADVVLDWNVIAVNTAIENKQGPQAQARYGAIVQVAVIEAVDAITREYRPYLGTIMSPPGASPEAAAIQAAYRVLVTYFPASQPALDSERANSLAHIRWPSLKMTVLHRRCRSICHDRASGQRRFLAPEFKIPGPPIPGEWQPTPSCPIVNRIPVGTFFHWQKVTPFGIARASEFLLDPPPALPRNEYAKTYNEVMSVGSDESLNRPPDRSDVARFYAASSPTLVFNQAARQVALERARTLTENARSLALMNMALSDSLVASFFNKYHYNFWRPETAIHAGDTDGNRKTDPDPSFVPFITTPCFPSYPSNHGSASNAAAEVLRRLYGEAGHSITLSNVAEPDIILQYNSFRQITDDISDARVYGGIHFRTDQVAGAALGRAVGTAVYKNNLRPVHDEE